MEAMKMEHTIKAPSNGTIDEVFFHEGDMVDGGAELLAFTEQELAFTAQDTTSEESE
jgi:3-methylcrotonyl-CoA carboxylase alpha subunit